MYFEEPSKRLSEQVTFIHEPTGIDQGSSLLVELIRNLRLDCLHACTPSVSAPVSWMTSAYVAGGWRSLVPLAIAPPFIVGFLARSNRYLPYLTR